MNMISLAAFVAKHRLSMTAERLPARTDRLMDDTPMNHWLCKIKNHLGDVLMEIPYSMGLGIVDKKPYEKFSFGERGGMTRNDYDRLPWAGARRVTLAQEQWMKSVYTPKAPTIEDVLNSIGSDAASIASARTFSDWCSELGYDDDSRKAERIYNACVDQYRELGEELGHAAREELMFQTERL